MIMDLEFARMWTEAVMFRTLMDKVMNTIPRNYSVREVTLLANSKFRKQDLLSTKHEF
jgi:hypothetical protein